MSDLDPCLAVIPARGGSKGLPGKNVRPLAGLPLIAHSLRCAALAPRIARTIVSTDSHEIARVARAHGGDVPFMRPAELASDEAPMRPVLQHALTAIEQAEGRRYGSLLLLDPTSPGRLPSDIERAFALLDGDPSADAAIACSRPTFNPFWVGVVVREGYLAPAFPEASRYHRRQDVPEFYRINGAVYLWRRDFLLASPPGVEGKRLLLEIPEARAFAIDYLEEFDEAAALIAAGLLELPWLTTTGAS